MAPQEWKDNKVCSQEFALWLETFLQSYTIVADRIPETGVPGTPSKRKSDEAPSPPPTKKHKTDGLVDTKDIADALLHKASLGKGQPELHIRAGPCIYLVATHQEGEVTLGPDSFLAGFGGGSFIVMRDDTPAQDAWYIFSTPCFCHEIIAFLLHSITVLSCFEFMSGQGICNSF